MQDANRPCHRWPTQPWRRFTARVERRCVSPSASRKPASSVRTPTARDRTHGRHRRRRSPIVPLRERQRTLIPIGSSISYGCLIVSPAAGSFLCSLLVRTGFTVVFTLDRKSWGGLGDRRMMGSEGWGVSMSPPRPASRSQRCPDRDVGAGELAVWRAAAPDGYPAPDMSAPGDRSAIARSSPRSKPVSAAACAPSGPVVDAAVVRKG